MVEKYVARPRHNYREESTTGSRSPDYLADGAARINSRNLLIAQLTYGQHSRGREAFWTAVTALRNEGHKL